VAVGVCTTPVIVGVELGVFVTVPAGVFVG
jgi:hypothetical protein